MTTDTGGWQPVGQVSVVADLDVFEDSVDALPMRIDRLTSRCGDVRVSKLDLPGVSVTTGSTTVPIRSGGVVADDALVVAVALTPGDGSWNGVEIAPNRAWCYRPKSEHDGAAARPPWWAAITVDLTSFGEHDRQRLAGGADVEIIESDGVGRVVDLARLADSTATGDVTTSMGMRLSAEVVDAIGSLGDGDERLTASVAYRLVRRCESIAPELGPIPTVRALAEAAGVSDRWVRRAFADTYGVAPSDYFRALALSHCRDELTAAPPGSVTVTDVATRWGFLHLGRFSARYSSFFGEPPSVTLARAVT